MPARKQALAAGEFEPVLAHSARMERGKGDGYLNIRIKYGSGFACRSSVYDAPGVLSDFPNAAAGASLAKANALYCTILERLAIMKSTQYEMRSVRGSATPMIILLLLVIAVAAGAAWWFLGRPDASAPLPVAARPGAPAGSAETAAPVISPAVEELSIDQLYREARTAMSEQRMVAPAGNNALEFYLAIIDKDSTNSGAKEALRELFPFASGTAEQEINQGNLVEANRIIESLAKADPSNYTLTILRSKMDAKKRQAEQQEAQATAAATAAETAAAAAAVPAPAPPVQTPTAAEAEKARAEAAAAAPPPPVVAAPPPEPTPAPQPQGETRDVVAVAPVAPAYPKEAARNREEGWVEVEFTVTADGAVENARVTASNPARKFDREAVRSIERSTFTPRLENGVPVSATVRRRIEFKLGG